MFSWSYIQQVLPSFEQAFWLALKISTTGILVTISIVVLILSVLCIVLIFCRLAVYYQLEASWSYIQQVLPSYKQALLLTLEISAFGIVAAILIGLLCSVAIFYRIAVFSQIAKGYVAFFRNTPLLLHLFFIYFGLPRAFNITLSFETTALIGLSLLGGAYMAEAFRSGIEAVAKSQFESGQAIGLNRWQMVRYIILPQAISYCIPALGANCIFLFKETSVFTAIAGTDVTTIAINFINNDGHTNNNLLLLVVAYLVVIVPFIFILSYVEKKVRHAEFGN